MKDYINNLIPRLREFSTSLDKKETFVEKPWVVVDNDLNQQKYIFRRDGDLIMSLNGQVTLGKWEFLSAARCLLINRIKDIILLNQDFIDPALMILKKDGFKDENFILVNELIIPDLNVFEYLKKLYYKKFNISECILKDGRILEISNYNGFTSYNMVSIEGEKIDDCEVEPEGQSFKYLIKNSKLVGVIHRKKYKTNRGEIIIEKQNEELIIVGDSVFQDNIPAPDGKYKLGFFGRIEVKDGKVC